MVEKFRKEGKNIVYGDSHNMEILQHSHLSAASLVVLTFKSLEEGKAAIGGIRQRHSSIPIIVRCLEHGEFEELISIGANQVFPELLESSLLVSRQALEMLEVEEREIERQIGEYRDQATTRVD